MFDGIIRIATKVETKDFDAQIKYLEKEAETIEKTLESDLKVPVEVRMDERSRLQLKAKLGKIKNQIISLQEQANKGIDIKETKGTSKSFEDMTRSAKKFILSLISIRGVYTLLSKASQAYMATDENTTNQLEANWVGLGTILAPAIQLIVNLFKKAVTSILYFMSVLTGVNYIQKANTAILKKQTQATNDLTKANGKLNASFDEMNVLQDNSQSASAGASVDTNSFFDISDISESARNSIEKIATALQPVYKKIKDLFDWAKQNPEVVLGILGGVALLSMLGKVIGVAGMGATVGTGLAGIFGLLTAIAGMGIITISIVTIYKSVKEANTAIKKVDENISDLTESTRNYTSKLKKANEEGKLTNDQLYIQADYLQRASEKSLELSKKYDEQSKSGGFLQGIVSAVTGEYGHLKKASIEYLEQAAIELETQGELYEQGKLNEEQTKKYKEQLQLFTETVDENSISVDKLTGYYGLNKDEAEKLNEKFKNMSEKLKDVKTKTDETKKPLENMSDDLKDVSDKIKNIPNYKTVKVNADTSGAKSTLNTFFSKLSSGISSVFGGSFSFPKLAVGGIVNNPGRGVPIGGAITGEAGREGVIPLTDAQAMEELGRTIGQYITINANITNTMNGRVISRELHKINANDDFATNS